MSRSASFVFNDPDAYGAAVRGGELEVLVTAKGSFRAELTHIDLGRLWMQYGSDNLPRVFRRTPVVSRTVFAFLADAEQASMQHSGMELSAKAIIVYGAGSGFMTHHRTWHPCRWASMSLSPDDLQATSRAIVGHEPPPASASRLLRPDSAHMTRLVRLHAAARRLADTAPDVLVHPEVSRALEHELIHAMVTCLADEAPAMPGSGWRRHTAVIDRFEEVLAANDDRPMHLAEICAAVGASERTLRASCEEHLGMGPIRYLWLRRMHLARRALLHADPAQTTVTQIATAYGFWELGRFAVSYQSLFGESPSAALRKPPGNRRAIQARPSSFADSDFA
jgi:AraC-like DNA-binding protein